MNAFKENHFAETSAFVEPSDAQLKDIETRGFAVIRNFLSKKELADILEDFQAARQTYNQNDNYPVVWVGHKIVDYLTPRIKDVGRDVAGLTSTTVDTPFGAMYFSLSGIKFSWHQDHESYFMNQDHVDYMNFYIVIDKEKVEEGNLHVVPFDKLKAKGIAYYNMVVGSGARWYTVKDGKTHILSDETGASAGIIPFDIGAIMETPHLHAGDLLLLRGDIIHSSQASNSRRVALSFRMINSKTRINLPKLVSGGKPKRVIMTNYRTHYNRYFNAFKKRKTTELTNADLIDHLNNDHSQTPGKWVFIFRMLMLRFRFMFR